MKPNHQAPWARGGLLAVLAVAALAFAGGAHAQNTAAGTTISNKATLNYSVGAVAQPAIASSPTGSNNGTGATTDFVVDNKINVQVATTDAAAIVVVPGQGNVVTNFTVTNTGNNPQGFQLAVGNVAGGTVLGATDNFDLTLPGACTVNVNGTGQTNIDTLAIGASVPVTVSCSIPLGQVHNDAVAISLTARAAQAGTAGATLMSETVGAGTLAGVDVVFADVAGSDDANRDGRHSARSAYRVVTAALVVTKTAAVLCDPFNGDTAPKAIPGAFVRYTVTIVNGGGASASLTTMSDTLSGNVDFDPDMIAGTGAGPTQCQSGVAPVSAAGSGFRLNYTARGGSYDPKYMTSTAGDTDGASHAAGVLTFNFADALPAGGTYAVGELKAGETLTLVYQVKIK